MINDDPARTIGGAESYKKRRILMICPKPIVTFSPVTGSILDSTHRVGYGGPYTALMTTPYAGNVGFSDGSVKFYHSPRGTTIDTLQ